MNKKIEETLKVLEMEEDEQWNFLIARKDIQEMCQNQLDAWSQPEYKRRVLADLAFRLRDKLHNVIGGMAWDRACWEVWKYIKIQCHSNIFERKHLSIEKREMYCCHWIAFWAKSIDLIVTALIAKEILADYDEKFDAHLASEYKEDDEDVSVPAYAIGQDDGNGGYGMWNGPTPSLQDMLDIDGRDDNTVLIRFNVDGTDDLIYRWTRESWVPEFVKEW